LAVRFTLLQAVYTVLLVGGGLTALISDRLGLDALKTIGLIVVFLALIVFGLDMIVHRRAEIGTRYTSSVNPSFNVFRGYGAIAWGLVFVLVGLSLAGYAYISLTDWTAAQNFFKQHTSVFIMMAGAVVIALGFGSATKATYRYQNSERPVQRLADRLAAIFLVIPLGLAISGWGFLRTFAPSTAERISTLLKSAVLRYIEFFLK
jgi:tryptophan-rich sensory protein